MRDALHSVRATVGSAADTPLAFYYTLQQKFTIGVVCISVRRISYDVTMSD